MAMSAEQIQALADAVASWRLQEYIYIAVYCFYVYYVLTTIAEEVTVVLPQRWNRGKIFYMSIRYATLVYIALQLSRDYRNYFSISPEVCKALLTALHVVTSIASLLSEFSLGLCLAALLEAKAIFFCLILALSCGISLVNAIFGLVSFVQYPAEPVSHLDIELGYPCYFPSSKEWGEQTIIYVGRDARTYVNLACTVVLALLAAMTVIVRYKGQGGKIIHVIRRDGGLHYLSLLAIRVAFTVSRTVMSVSDFNSSWIYL
ncbi:hypothetical protein FA13DRAFT_595242 [Coprinellus micaceus]|uniref:DUF6533 domain-containing protein n=1 Tax=Coprinellus micaceus TaxID=71717 RepID=A0A4Y7T851_COPMI|nr:hypothetical protein FA13DRAFT_595242 [Coprinellus micaceus]